MKHFIYILIFIVLLTACGPVSSDSHAARPIDSSSISPEAPMNNDQYAPQPGDDALTRGNVFLESINMLTMESYPVQVSVNLAGSLPTSCHNLRAIINMPDANKNINIELYSVIDPNLMCTQVLQPFEATLSLGSFPVGHYTVLINDEKLGEFDS
jgi:hypothetical protein